MKKAFSKSMVLVKPRVIIWCLLMTAFDQSVVCTISSSTHTPKFGILGHLERSGTKSNKMWNVMDDPSSTVTLFWNGKFDTLVYFYGVPRTPLMCPTVYMNTLQNHGHHQTRRLNIFPSGFYICCITWRSFIHLFKSALNTFFFFSWATIPCLSNWSLVSIFNLHMIEFENFY